MTVLFDFDSFQRKGLLLELCSSLNHGTVCSFKGERSKENLFHSFVATVISMWGAKKFLKSNKGLRFYSCSKFGNWGFCVIQVCVRKRTGANTDVMSRWEGKLHATSKDNACKSLL